jgi:hypothetical protein
MFAHDAWCYHMGDDNVLVTPYLARLLLDYIVNDDPIDQQDHRDQNVLCKDMRGSEMLLH